jgi:hypothetical protein
MLLKKGRKYLKCPYFNFRLIYEMKNRTPYVVMKVAAAHITFGIDIRIFIAFSRPSSGNQATNTAIINPIYLIAAF